MRGPGETYSELIIRPFVGRDADEAIRRDFAHRRIVGQLQDVTAAALQPGLLVDRPARAGSVAHRRDAVMGALFSRLVPHSRNANSDVASRKRNRKRERNNIRCLHCFLRSVSTGAQSRTEDKMT
jgi:hypothetical protein